MPKTKAGDQHICNSSAHQSIYYTTNVISYHLIQISKKKLHIRLKKKRQEPLQHPTAPNTHYLRSITDEEKVIMTQGEVEKRVPLIT